MIRFEDVHRNYDDLKAVNGVSVQIETGQIVGLLGHNGAGKTTLMKMLTGFIEPTSGRVLVDGKDVVTDRLFVQSQIGYLPENAPLYPEMTVQDYLLMMADLRGIPASKKIELVGRAAQRTRIIPRLTQTIGTLSKGFKQRVGLAQAILHEPPLLVLDEPTNGLDPVQIQSIRDLIRELGETSTIILSTHIMQEVEAVCDRVIILIQGKLAADSSLKDLIASSTIHLELQGDVNQGLLEQLPGITSIKPIPHPKYSCFELEHEPEAVVGPAIQQLAEENHWKIIAIAPERRTLDSVFQALQHQHVHEMSGGRA